MYSQKVKIFNNIYDIGYPTIKFLYFIINIDNQISIMNGMNGHAKYQLKKRLLKQMSKNTNEIISNFYASMGEIRTTTHSSLAETNVAKKNKKVVLPFLNDNSNMTINNEFNVAATDDEIKERIIQNTESTESFVDDLNVEHDENFNANDDEWKIQISDRQIENQHEE